MGDENETDYSRAAAELRSAISRLVAAVYPNTGGPGEVSLNPAEYAKALSELGRLERWLNGLHEASAAENWRASNPEPVAPAPETPPTPHDEEIGAS